MDIVVVDEETRQFVSRPWLTLGTDVLSRMVTGFALSFDPLQRTSVGLCLLHSVFDKTAWLREFEIDLPWPVTGLPRRLGVDNGVEFHSKDFVWTWRDFGVRVEHRPVGGHVERLIGHRWEPFDFSQERPTAPSPQDRDMTRRIPPS
jgi:putative transposase